MILSNDCEVNWGLAHPGGRPLVTHGLRCGSQGCDLVEVRLVRFSNWLHRVGWGTLLRCGGHLVTKTKTSENLTVWPDQHITPEQDQCNVHGVVAYHWSDHNKVAGTFNAIPTLLLPTLRDLFLSQNIDVGGIDKWPLCRISLTWPDHRRWSLAQTIQNRSYIINSSPVTVADTKHQNLYNIALNPFISGHFGKGGRGRGTVQTTH